MRNRAWTVLLFSAAIVCVGGCSDNDGSGAGTAPDFSNTAVSEVMGSNVLPAIQSVAFTTGFIDQFAALSSGGSSTLGEPSCSTEVCGSGGSVTTCVTSTGDAEFEFTSCIEIEDHGAFTIDGTLLGECTQNVSDVTCDLVIDLQVTFSSAGASFGFELLGDLSETFDAESLCTAITRSDYGMTVLGDATSMSGSLESCFGEPYPTGHKSVTVISRLHGDYLFDMYFDGTNDLAVTVFDHNDGARLGTCTVDFDTGNSVCNAT